MTMIRWEPTLHVVACSNCGSHDTRVSFEFLSFARRVCRNCGATFVTITDSAKGERVVNFRRFKTQHR